MKRPAFQFYPGDWRKDNELRSCTAAARGLWIEMMVLAHECSPYGHLMIGGSPMDTETLARLTAISFDECERLLSELDVRGVFSRADNGAIYSRRMVRDERVRNARAAGGEKGAEYGQKGAEHGAKGGRPRGDNKPPLNPPPSTSTASSASALSEKKEPSICAEPTALALVDDPVLITFPTNRPGQTYAVVQSHFDQFTSLYPAVDVPQELRGMAGWLIANPKNAKTASGMPRFINSWLSKAQNRSKPNGNGKTSRNDNWLAGAAELADELRQR